MKLEEMRSRAAAFAQRIDEVKASVEEPEWGWYPYRMLPAFLDIFDRMLTGENRKILEEPADMHVADVGAADGDFSFFLESIGFTVDIVDGGDPSIRDLRLLPASRLKAGLGSNVNVHGVDLDRDFELPREYSLIFCLGVGYHLRNPMLMFETLARAADHCILSTKIARYMPAPGRFGQRKRIDISAVPVAYLLDPYEVNKYDASNYWVFSEAGLRRTLKRSGWSVLDLYIVGNTEDAEPASAEEARAFCLLRSDIRTRGDIDPGLPSTTPPPPEASGLRR